MGPGAGNVSGVSSGRKFVKPLVAAVGLAGTIASIWWFALKPRRKRAKHAVITICPGVSVPGSGAGYSSDASSGSMAPGLPGAMGYVCDVTRRRFAIPPSVRVIFVSATIAMGLAACGSSPAPSAKAATTASTSGPQVDDLVAVTGLLHPEAPAGGPTTTTARSSTRTSPPTPSSSRASSSPGGQHERIGRKGRSASRSTASNTAAGAAPSSGRQARCPATSSDQRAASACICSRDVNSRPRQNESRTYGIGRSTRALDHIVNDTRSG